MFISYSSKSFQSPISRSIQVLSKYKAGFGYFTRDVSSIKGESSIPLIQKPLPRIFEEKVEEFKHKDLMIFPNEDLRFTFKETKTHTDAFASGLIDIFQTRPRQMVSLLQNEAENQTTSLACAKIGVGVIPFAQDASMEKLAEILDLTKAYGLIINSKIQKPEELEKLIPELSYWLFDQWRFKCERFPSLRNIIHLEHRRYRGMLSFQNLMLYNRRPATVPKTSAQVQPEDAMYVVATSPSTALTYDQRSIANLSYFVGNMIQLGMNDRVFFLIPNSMEMFGVGTWSCIQHGAVMVVPKKLDASEYSTIFEREQCNTIISDTISLSNLMISADSVKSRYNGVEKILIVDQNQPSPDLVQKLKQFPRLKSLFSFSSSQGIVFDENTGKGRVLPHTEAKVVDSSGKVIEFNKEGELHTKGYHVPRNTLGKDDRIGDSGWMNSKTRVKVDENGFFTRVQIQNF